MKQDEQQTVLIVDDAPANLRLLGTALSKRYSVQVATSGAQALSIAAASPSPDLILLDIVMPGMDGYEVCRQLKDMPETRDIPVIFITAKDDERDEEQGLNMGAIDYITKPFSLPVVSARVRNHLELKRLRDLWKATSMIDGLTGIANRRRFDEHYEMEMRRAERSEASISVLLADIDVFKNYNDTYGHLAGDECLKKVAKTMAEELRRPTDFVARWGGEEFAVLLPDTDGAGAVFLAEQIRQGVCSLAIPHESSPTASVVTVSIGTSTTVGQDAALTDLMQQADEALYVAKKLGRNRVCSYHPKLSQT